jgi:hypothetical protein
MTANELRVSRNALECSEVVVRVGNKALQTILLAVIAEAGNGVFGFDVIACCKMRKVVRVCVM